MNEYAERASTLRVKERQKIPAREMPVQEAELSSYTMLEVALGYILEQAKAEAFRCMQCEKKKCIKGCPAQINIPRFIDHIAKGEIEKAIAALKETTLLPLFAMNHCSLMI